VGEDPIWRVKDGQNNDPTEGVEGEDAAHPYEALSGL